MILLRGERSGRSCGQSSGRSFGRCSSRSWGQHNSWQCGRGSSLISTSCPYPPMAGRHHGGKPDWPVRRRDCHLQAVGGFCCCLGSGRLAVVRQEASCRGAGPGAAPGWGGRRHLGGGLSAADCGPLALTQPSARLLWPQPAPVCAPSPPPLQHRRPAGPAGVPGAHRRRPVAGGRLPGAAGQGAGHGT